MSRLHVSGPSLFQPGGLSYFKVPHKYRKVIKGAALEVLAALDAFCLKKTVVVISDAVIARFLDRSIRYVQRGLKRLEKHQLIWRFTEWAEGVKCRTIHILESLIESDAERRNRERREKLATKNFGPGMVKNDHTFGSTSSIAPSFEGEQSKDKQAPGGGESDGTDPPPGLGSGATASEAAADPQAEAQAAADPLAVMLAAAAEVAPVEPPSSPRPSPETPAARKPVAETLAERKARAEPLARAGDRVAIAELAEIERAEQAALPRDPAPPRVAPPPPIERPRSDPPRASPLALVRSFIAWLRRKRE